MIYSAKEFTLKNGLKVILKSPGISDAPKLLDSIIKTSATTDYITSLPEDYQKYLDDMSKEEAFISGSNDNDNSYLIAVYVKDIIVGNCFLDFLGNIKTRHRGRIGIAITEEYRGMGIGSLLFDEMIKLAKKRKNVTQLELEVIKENEWAKRLYTSKGFVKTGDRPRVLRLPNGKYLDEELMVLYLDK